MFNYNTHVESLRTIVARRMRQARESAGLTQGELAEYLGVTRALVTGVEAGRVTLTLEHLEKLPKLLNHPTEYFLGITIPGLTEDEQSVIDCYRQLPLTGPHRK